VSGRRKLNDRLYTTAYTGSGYKNQKALTQAMAYASRERRDMTVLG